MDQEMKNFVEFLLREFFVRSVDEMLVGYRNSAKIIIKSTYNALFKVFAFYFHNKVISFKTFSNFVIYYAEVSDKLLDCIEKC